MNTMTIAPIKNKDRHAGIDVGKSLFDIYIFERELHWQVSNDSSGIEELLMAQLATRGRRLNFDKIDG